MSHHTGGHVLMSQNDTEGVIKSTPKSGDYWWEFSQVQKNGTFHMKKLLIKCWWNWHLNWFSKVKWFWGKRKSKQTFFNVYRTSLLTGEWRKKELSLDQGSQTCGPQDAFLWPANIPKNEKKYKFSSNLVFLRAFLGKKLFFY